MIISLVLTTVLLVAGEVSSSLESEKDHIKVRIKRKHADKVPNFHSKTLDLNMESKLGHAQVGNGGVRHRRDEANAKALVKNAETHSAEAAANADEAKKNALKALSEDQQLEEEIEKSKATATGGRSQQVLDRGSLPHQNSKEDEEEDEEYEDDSDDDEDDGDDDVAEETIVDDGVAQIKTTIIEPRPISNHVKKVTENVTNHKTTKAPTVSTGSTNSNSENSVCKGLLDLKSMTDDFRKSLRSLLDREEQVIQRLEHVEQNIRRQRTVEPSKACVYIEENVGDTRRLSKIPTIHNQLTVQNNKSTKANNFERMGPPNLLPDSEPESRIHVYTSQGVMPQPALHQVKFTNSSAQNNNLAQQQKQNHHQHSNVSHILITSIKPSKSTREISNSYIQKDENHDSSSDADIDLSNIYWLKSEPDEQGKEHTNTENNKYQNVINGIRENGHDVLIIPISSKFKTAKEVAKILFDTMTDRHFMGRFSRDKKRRKLRLRVRRL